MPRRHGRSPIETCRNCCIAEDARLVPLAGIKHTFDRPSDCILVTAHRTFSDQRLPFYATGTDAEPACERSRTRVPRPKSTAARQACPIRLCRSIMQDDEFEWDDDKAAQNFAAHGVSFEAGRLAFDDVFAVERVDPGALRRTALPPARNGSRPLACRCLHDAREAGPYYFGALRRTTRTSTLP